MCFTGPRGPKPFKMRAMILCSINTLSTQKLAVSTQTFYTCVDTGSTPFSLEIESLLLLNTSGLYTILINTALVEFCVMQACAVNDDTAVTLRRWFR